MIINEYRTYREHYYRDDNDLLQGKYTKYFPDGRISSIRTYKDGFKNGEYTKFTKCPSKHSRVFVERGMYRNGKRYGEWIIYTSTGGILHHLIYVDNTPVEFGHDGDFSEEDKMIFKIKYPDIKFLTPMANGDTITPYTGE